MKYREQINMLIALLVLMLLTELIIFGGLGFAVPVAVGIYYFFLAWRYKGKGERKQFFKNPLVLPIVLTSLCFAIFDNEIFKVFNTIWLLSLIILHLSVSFKVNQEEAYTPKWFLKIFSVGVALPFENMGNAIGGVREEIEQIGGKKEKLQVLNKIFIGCLIGIPLMLVAGLLLMTADAAFEGVVDWMLYQINIDLGWFIQRFFIYGILFFPFVGFLHGLTRKEVTKQELIGEEDEAGEMDVPKKAWRLDFTIGMTVISLLSVVYILYIFSQLTYFLSAFNGILPEGYTYAEYARRGFFEMLPIAGLNLGVIGVLNLVTNGKEEKKKAQWIKGYTTFIIGFTLFIMVTALAKMAMYMGIYGLTLKRVFVSWVLILGVISFLLIGVKIYRERFKLTKHLFVSFSILYLGLNYSNVDYLIGQYNLKLNQEKQINTITGFYDLSLSAVDAYIEIDKNDASEESTSIYWYYQSMIQQEKDWREENIAGYIAKEKWKGYFEKDRTIY